MAVVPLGEAMRALDPYRGSLDDPATCQDRKWLRLGLSAGEPRMLRTGPGALIVEPPVDPRTNLALLGHMDNRPCIVPLECAGLMYRK